MSPEQTWGAIFLRVRFQSHLCAVALQKSSIYSILNHSICRQDILLLLKRTDADKILHLKSLTFVCKWIQIVRLCYNIDSTSLRRSPRCAKLFSLFSFVAVRFSSMIISILRQKWD
jgi:hypothetical protein